MDRFLRNIFFTLLLTIIAFFSFSPGSLTKSPEEINRIKKIYYQNHLLRYKNIFRYDERSEGDTLVDILTYDLYFDLHPEEKLLKGIAKIKFTLKNKNTNYIDLNFYDNFDLTGLLLNGKNIDYDYDENLLSIPLNGTLPDTSIVEVRYEGTPGRGGFVGFAFGTINDNSLVYTLSEPDYASTWFPCNDIPVDKALLDIRIENDSSKISVSNGILMDVKNKGDRKVYHWKTLYPISTYLITLYSSDYVSFSDDYISLDEQDTMKIEYYVLPDKLDNARIDFAENPKIMKFFAETFGEYPFINEKYGVAEFLWQLGAMEHQTITGVASNLIGGNNFFLDVYIHELAHHWWGDAVGPKSWNDIWLNEGFSSYCEALYFESVSGRSALFSTMQSKYQENFNGILSNPESNLFSSTVYNKGAWVLHMLRWEVGDSLFFSSLRAYYEKFKYSNAATGDFITVCDSVTGGNLDDFFEQWIDRKGQIELEYDYRTYNKDNKYITEIKLIQLNDLYKFPLEIQFKYDEENSDYFRIYVDAQKQEISFQTITEPKQVILDPKGWLLMNIR